MDDERYEAINAKLDVIGRAVLAIQQSVSKFDTLIDGVAASGMGAMFGIELPQNGDVDEASQTVVEV